MNDFCMPSLGADMTKGTIVKWLVAPGDQINRGDVIVDVETDKGVISVETWESGKLAEIIVPEGQEAPVGTLLARIGDEALPTVSPHVTELERRRISPLARKVAKELGVDVTEVKGSGRNGEVSRADVEHFAGQLSQPEPQLIHEPEIKDDQQAMRRAISKAVEKSKKEIPHYYLNKQMTLQKLKLYLDNFNSHHPVTERILMIAPIVKAIGLVLHEYPDFLGWYRDGQHVKTDQINISLAISLRSGGLMFPCIHDIDRMSVPTLMTHIMDVTQRARSGRLRSSELMDGVIGLTSLGENGCDSVYGVIYPPQVAMIGIGGINQTPWAENAMMGIHVVTTVTLAADHRVSDGHTGSRLLNALSERLQAPENIWHGVTHESGAVDSANRR